MRITKPSMNTRTASAKAIGAGRTLRPRPTPRSRPAAVPCPRRLEEFTALLDEAFVVLRTQGGA